MTHEQVLTYLNICYFVYMPIILLLLLAVIIYIGYKQVKKEEVKSFKKSIVLGTTPAKQLTTILFLKTLPFIILCALLLMPVFYLNHQERQFDYCKDIIRVNKITSADNAFFQKRCSFYDAKEFFPNE